MTIVLNSQKQAVPHGHVEWLISLSNDKASIGWIPSALLSWTSDPTSTGVPANVQYGRGDCPSLGQVGSLPPLPPRAAVGAGLSPAGTRWLAGNGFFSGVRLTGHWATATSPWWRQR